MTVPSEELNALIMARGLLVELLDPKATPKVPKSIRERAYRLLRHYPAEYKIDEMWAASIKKYEDEISKFGI